MDTTSHWIATAPLPRFPRLEQSVHVDVVVVGGGITGITTAYLLKQAGRKVALLERDCCARVDTGHTTAHVTAVPDRRLFEIEKQFGRDAARAVWDAGGAAIDQIVALIRAEDIACDFRWVPGYLHAPLDGASADAVHELRREADLAREIGIAAQFLDAVPALGRPGVKFAHQALFHPRKYLAALLQKIPGGGSHVFEQSEAGEVQEEPLRVRVGEHTIHCERIVLATHNPLMCAASMAGAALFQSKLALYTSYAVGARLEPELFPEASFWDTSDPYYYLRVEQRHGFDYAIFGGEDHKTGQARDTREHYARLIRRFRDLAPKAVIDRQWSGQVIATTDGLPFIGELVENQFGATGFAGSVMTFGTLGAMMAVDWIEGRKNPWQQLFDPARKQVLGGTWSYLTENKDYPYYMLRDWLGGTEGKSLRDLKRGEGKILQLDGRKVAAYRADDGEVSLCSPVCTHLKCIVGWNEAERTWDCPCHGSRFKPTGEVISGPAEEPLAKLPAPPEK